jgi:hypothetical protein
MNTIYFPAHPSYFNNEFTQQQIDVAIGDLEMTMHPTPGQIIFLREPGRSEGVKVDESPFQSFSPDDRAAMAKTETADCAHWLRMQREWIVKEMRRATGQ